MSLLLDALKRAEQEKIARGERPDLQIVSPTDPGAAHPSAPPAAARDAASPAAKGAFELQPIAQPGAGAGTASKAASPAAAQAVFQAKLHSAGAQDKPKRGWIYAVVGALILAVVAAGAYVWYVMQQLAPAQVPARRMPGPVAPPPAPLVPAPAPSSASSMPTLSPVPERASLAATVTTTTTTSGTAAAEPKAPPGPLTREQAAAELLRQAPARREAPVRLDRAPQGPRISSDVSTGYQALRNSDLAAARRAYEAAVTADATNVDALLGMATVEARSGNAGAAAASYRRALELDARNPTALAGLASLADPSRRGTVEARLREDVMRYPQSPALHFTLGNVYSAQARWSEAQGEYFEAHRLDPSNPDIAHNLAVALDHLGQARVAAEFYRRALDAARTQPAQFDPAPVARRLAELGS